MGKVGFEPTSNVCQQIYSLPPSTTQPLSQQTKDTHMPQLDKVSYFTQFFWLTLTITTFYITLLKFYLPTLHEF